MSTWLQLYEAGARNFLLINEPPMDLAPMAEPGLKPLIADVSPPDIPLLHISCFYTAKHRGFLFRDT